MPRTRRPLPAALLLLALTAALLVLPAEAAQAHDYLVRSSPAAGSTVTKAPSTVSLTFDAAVLDLGRGRDAITVTGPDARHYETACARVDGDTVTAAVALGRPGTYTIAWRIISADGHPVTDAITFVYRPAAGAPQAAGSARGPSCGDATGGATRFGAPGDTGTDSTDVAVVAIAAGATVLVLAAVGVVAVVLLRTARRDA